MRVASLLRFFASSAEDVAETSRQRRSPLHARVRKLARWAAERRDAGAGLQARTRAQEQLPGFNADAPPAHLSDYINGSVLSDVLLEDQAKADDGAAGGGGRRGALPGHLSDVPPRHDAWRRHLVSFAEYAEAGKHPWPHPDPAPVARARATTTLLAGLMTLAIARWAKGVFSGRNG